MKRVLRIALAADFLFRKCVKTFCRIDNRELGKVPMHGPLILVLNHINFLEVPLLHLELYPRPLIGMVKKETWTNWLFSFLFNAWDAIPLDRNTTDFTAFRKALAVLKAGKILCVAPEGTRSMDGKLLQGQAGITTLALHSRAPILPVVHYGGEKVWRNLRRIRKTRFVFRVGKPFKLLKPAGKVTSSIREKMTTEIMWQMALCLPEAYWGYYTNAREATTKHLEFV